MRSRSGSSRDEGVALIVAMLIVSIMSVAALETLQALRYATRMSVNVSDREQSRLYALGAETFAKVTLSKLAGNSETSRPMLDAATREPINLPIEGGLIEIKVEDGANCFNLNALVSSEGQQGQVKDTVNASRFHRMLTHMGMSASDADNLTAALVDWLDSDTRPEFGGAEDAYYASLDEPYRAADQLLIDLSEIRAIPGFNAKLFAALKPLICVRPTQDLSPINMNTVTLEEAPLVAALLGEEFSLQDVADILAERPVDGVRQMDDVWQMKVFATRPVTTSDQSMFALVSDYYDVRGRIWRNETSMSMHSTLKITGAGEINTVSRRFGVFE